jgi:hypothetical protein
MPVEIVSDPGKLLDPAGFDLVVAETAHYIAAVQLIKQTVRAGGSARRRILVHGPAAGIWLQRLARSYDGATVRSSSVSARALLAERWKAPIPDLITDDAILASGFLQTELVPRAGQSYEDIVLEHYWGEFFTFVSFPFALAGDLVESLEPARWEANRNLPLVMQALRARRESWLGQAKRPEQRDLITAAFDAPAEIKERLGRYKLVWRYPAQVGKAVLGKWLEAFKSLSIDPTPVSLGGLDLGQTVQEIMYYLNGLAPVIACETDLEAAVGQMSGCLFQEFDWLRNCVQTQPGKLTLTASLMETIARQFQPIVDEIGSGLEALQAAIPPPSPPDPSGCDSAETWLEWAVREYLPYRFWLEEADRWDPTVAGFAGGYADWLHKNYTNLKYQEQERWVFDILNRARTTLKQGRKVLLLVIDNFNYKHVSALMTRFARQGFHPVAAVEPVWSALPTTTEVSKHCLVAGEANLAGVQGKGYEDILDKDWRGYFEGYNVIYLPKLSALTGRQHFDADLILLNYLPIDGVLHQDEKQIGTSHTGEILHYLDALVEAVAVFVKRAEVEQELVVMVASDHGSTKLLPDFENHVDDKFYRKLAKDPHHRYIVVPDDRAANPTDYDKANCYVLPAKAFGNPESYFIPRGYGVFIKTDESIYVHGGLTPEETIVPFAQFMKTEVHAFQPRIRLPSNIVRYSVKASLLLMVGNPNEHDMANVELSVAESELPGVLVETITAGRSVEITIPVRIRRQPGAPDLTAITVEGSFELAGRKCTIEPVSIPVKARSLQESKTEFDFGL